MNSIILASIDTQFNELDFQDAEISPEDGVEEIAVLTGDKLHLLRDGIITSTFKLTEKFNILKCIPTYPHLFFLGKNTNFIVDESDDFIGYLEDADCEVAIYDSLKQEIIQRYPLKNSQIHTLSSWVDNEGEIKLSAFISQYFRKKNRDKLTFKKSYVDVLNIELEVIASHLITGKTDEEILTASCKGHILLYNDNFNQTRLINLETGQFVKQLLHVNRSSWPPGLDRRIGKLDLLTEDTFAWHFLQQSYVFDFHGQIISQYVFSDDLEKLFEPTKIIKDGFVLVFNKRSFGVASRRTAIKYIFEDD